MRADSDWWIPRDAASILAHRQASDDADVKSLDASDPPIRRAYTVELIHKGELVERQRDLLKVKSDILLFGPPNASPMAREAVSRRDIVSLRSTRFERVAQVIAAAVGSVDQGASTFHLPHSLGISSASLGTSAVMTVALLLQ